MIKSMRRMYGIYGRYRGRLILTQVLVLISALATIGALVDLQWAEDLSDALEEHEAVIELLIVGNNAWQS